MRESRHGHRKPAQSAGAQRLRCAITTFSPRATAVEAYSCVRQATGAPSHFDFVARKFFKHCADSLITAIVSDHEIPTWFATVFDPSRGHSIAPMSYDLM